MGVTRWLLIVFGTFSAVCGLGAYTIGPLLIFYTDGVTVEITLRTALLVPVGIIVILVPSILACLAAWDLDRVEAPAQERFMFRYLGWLGWFGVVLILYAIWLVCVYPFYANEVYRNLYSIVFIALMLEDYSKVALLGAACLYARYRIAANKRIAAPSDH